MSILTRCNRLCHTALLTLLLLPPLLHAEQEDRWYQVEVIIFSQNSPDYHDSERWPLDYTLPDLEQSRELVKPEKLTASQPAPLLPQPFSLVPAERLQLGTTAKRIQSAGDVELVLHLGWLQPGLAEEQAVAVHVYEGMLDEPMTATTATATADTTRTLPKLDGTLRLILSRYLHLQTDLLWREPLPATQAGFAEALPVFAAANSGAALEVNHEVNVAAHNNELIAETTPDTLNYRVFRLQQSRRMRSNEIHYLDHPLFGLIVQVTPYVVAPPKTAAPPKP